MYCRNMTKETYHSPEKHPGTGRRTFAMRSAYTVFQPYCSQNRRLPCGAAELQNSSHRSGTLRIPAQAPSDRVSVRQAVRIQAQGTAARRPRRIVSDQFSYSLPSEISLEKGGTGNNHIGTGITYALKRSTVHAAVDRNHIRKSAFISDTGKFGNFIHTLRNKLLSSESGIYRHDKYKICKRKNFLQYRNRCRRHNRDTRFFPKLAYMTEQTVNMNGALKMKCNPVGACSGKRINLIFRVLDHEMHVERQRSKRPYRLHDRLSVGDLRHKSPVHHIDMDDRASVLLYLPNCFPEI